MLLAVIAVILRRAGDRRHPLVPGTIMGLFLTWYGIGRFVTDFARVNDATVAGLTGAQWGSLVIALIGTWILATGSRRAERLAAQAIPDEARTQQPSNVRVLPDGSDHAAGRADDDPGPQDPPGPDDRVGAQDPSSATDDAEVGVDTGEPAPRDRSR